MRKNQRGQSMVEFAVILPFFLMLLAGITAFGMLFADYMSLNNAVRGIARDISINGENSKYKTSYQNYGTPTNLYVWDINKVTVSKSNSNVVVTVKAPLNSKSGLKGFFGFLTSKENRGKNNGWGIIPDPVSITYTMYDEHSK